MFCFLNSGRGRKGGRGESDSNNTPGVFMALYCISVGCGKGWKHIHFIPVNLL